MSAHPVDPRHRAGLAVLTERLLDDAAIFPPGNAPMSEALSAHLGWQAGSDAAIVGPFVCSLGRLGELGRALDVDADVDAGVDGRAPAGTARPLQVAVVVSADRGDFFPVLSGFFGLGSGSGGSGSGDGDGGQRLRGARLAALEVALAAGEPATSTGSIRLDDLVPVVSQRSRLLDDEVEVVVELPSLPTSAGQLAPLAEVGLPVKFRTGGLVAAGFPDEVALGRAIAAAVEAGVSFKCTAGLHRAVRHRGEDGFEHHGFCNVLVASKRAIAGADLEAVVEALGERDGHRLAEELFALEADQAAAVRRAFRSFGTCSIEEPLQDLRRLGLLA